MQSVSELQSSDQLKVRLNTAFLLLGTCSLNFLFRSFCPFPALSLHHSKFGCQGSVVSRFHRDWDAGSRRCFSLSDYVICAGRWLWNCWLWPLTLITYGSIFWVQYRSRKGNQGSVLSRRHRDWDAGSSPEMFLVIWWLWRWALIVEALTLITFYLSGLT